MSVKSSYTLWSPSDTVKDAAEVLGLANLPDEVAKTLAMDIEYRIHEVVEQALKFMRHSKRSTLTARDISAALRVLNVEPLYGYETGRPLHYKEAMVGPGQTLYYVDEDDEVDFEKLINEAIPKVPREPTFTAHWLAIEGVQPAIPQNPHSNDIKSLPPAAVGSQISHSTKTLTQDVDVKPLVKHMISKELQLYFDRIVQVLLEGTDKDTALFSLRNDPGLHQLTPYFVQFVQEKISVNLKTNHNVLRTMLDVLDALLSNPAIFIKPYVHQIIPSTLTVLISRKVGPFDNEESYELRNYAASLLRKLSQMFGQTHYTMRPRLTRTFLKGFLDTERSLPSIYGILTGIEALGSEVIRVIIVGNLKAWFEPAFARAQEAPQLESLKLEQALIAALRSLGNSNTSPPSEQALAEVIGHPAAQFAIEHGVGGAIIG